MGTTFVKRNMVILFAGILSVHFLFLLEAWSLDYPTKPINLIASASAGGPFSSGWAPIP